jgi:hypothetical protein
MARLFGTTRKRVLPIHNSAVEGVLMMGKAAAFVLTKTCT